MITIGYSTRVSNPNFKNYLIQSCGLKGIEVIEKVNNGDKSLSQVYNEIIDESSKDIIILCHDDIYFDTKNWGKKLLNHFNNTDFSILGVAGTTDLPVTGRWWDDKSKMVGIVNHEYEGKKWESKYSKSWGDEIMEVVLIDGLFISLDKKKLKKKFDSSVDGFHFYDVTFSVENFLSGAKLGVISNIRLTHKSIGMTNESWEQNRSLFVKKFESHLPIKFTPEIKINDRIDNSVKKIPIKIIINTKNQKEKLLSFLSKLEEFSLTNYSINLLVHEDNLDNYKEFVGHDIKIFKSYYNEINKSLSVLRWNGQFVNKNDNLIYITEEDSLPVNNIFFNFVKIYKNHIGNFGCLFPISLRDDKTILSSQFNFVMNQKNFMISIKDKGSYYNVLSGVKQSPSGSISNSILTTLSNLEKLDWFDISYKTNISFLDFAVRCSGIKKMNFTDTDSLVVAYVNDTSKDFSNDINSLLNITLSNDTTKKLIQIQS